MTRLDPLTQDRALLDGFRRGDRRRLEQVYRLYVREVMTVARHGFIRGPHRLPGVGAVEVMDVVQEVFLRAFGEDARRGYDGLRPYGPYLRQITRNLLTDRARRRATDVAKIEALEREEMEPAAPPEERLDFQRRRELTRAFLATQSEEVQTFVRLRFDEEKSQADVKAAMDVTRRRVRTLEARVLRDLAAYLEEVAADPVER